MYLMDLPRSTRGEMTIDSPVGWTMNCICKLTFCMTRKRISVHNFSDFGRTLNESYEEMNYNTDNTSNSPPVSTIKS